MADDIKPDDIKPDDKPDDKPDEKPDDEAKLGPAGEKALADERKSRRDADRRAKTAEAELEKLKNASATEQEKAVAAAKAEGRTGALEIANQRLLRAEITASAAGKLADPSDAAALLDLNDFEVDDDGNVDKKAISTAIEELVKRKPHLAARGGRPSGDGGGGPRGTPADDSFSMDRWLRSQANAGRR